MKPWMILPINIKYRAFFVILLSLSPLFAQTSSPLFNDFLSEARKKGGFTISQRRDMEVLLASLPVPEREKLPLGFPLKKDTAFHIMVSFGLFENPFTGRKYFSNYVSFSCENNSPVQATAEGTVVSVTQGRYRGIVIRHKWNFYTQYKGVIVTELQPGDRVQKGQIMGKSATFCNETFQYYIYLGKPSPFKRLSTVIYDNIIDPSPFLYYDTSPLLYESIITPLPYSVSDEEGVLSAAEISKTPLTTPLL